MFLANRGVLAAWIVVGVAGTAVACASSARDGFDTDALPVSPADGDEAGTSSGFPSFGDASGEGGNKPAPISTDPVDVVFTADNAYAFGWGDATSLANFSRARTRRSRATSSTARSSPAERRAPRLAAVAPSRTWCPPPTRRRRPTSTSSPGRTRAPRKVRSDSSSAARPTRSIRATTPGRSARPASSTTLEPLRHRAVEGRRRGEARALQRRGRRRSRATGGSTRRGAVTAGALGNLALGEDNSRGRTSDTGGLPADGVFPITCQKDANGNQGIDPDAHWMWYQPPGFTTEQAFTNNSGNATKTYLIFRVKAADIPVEPVK